MSSDCQIQQACRCCLERAIQDIERQNQSFTQQRAIIKNLELLLAEQQTLQRTFQERLQSTVEVLEARSNEHQSIKVALERLRYMDELTTRTKAVNVQSQQQSHTLKVMKRPTNGGQDSQDLYDQVSIVLSGGEESDEEPSAFFESIFLKPSSGTKESYQQLELQKATSHVVINTVVHHQNMSKSQFELGRHFTKGEILVELSNANQYSRVNAVGQPAEEEQCLLIEKLLRERPVSFDPQELRAELGKHHVLTIPYIMREKVWPLLIGNALFVTEQVYQRAVKKADGGLDRLTVKTIQCDLTRTYPHISLFQEDTIIMGKLRQLLHALAIECRCGYVQGMAYPASLALLVMNKQIAFQFLVNLLSTQFLFRLFTFDEQDYQLKNRVFDYLIKKHLPKTWKHLHRSGISSEVLLVEWFYSLFCRAFRLEVVMKVWDRILIDGEHSYYSFALAVLKLSERIVLQAEPVQAYNLIKRLSRELTFEQLMDSIKKLGVSPTCYEDTICLYANN